MHTSLLALLALLTSLLLPATTLAQPDIYLGTVDNCSPARNAISYVAWLVASNACANNGDATALTPIGTYPYSNAGCGYGNFTVGGLDFITFDGCLGPVSPYPTSLAINGKKRWLCEPIPQPVEDRLCTSDLCKSLRREGLLRTVLICRKRRGRY